MKRSLVSGVIAIALLGAVAVTGADSAAGDDHVSVVASGLDQPRGLGFAANGSLLISEAGRGGDGSDGCGDPILQQGVPMCLGATGAVTRVKPNGQQSRIIEGLASIANPDTGDFAFGPQDVATRHGQVYVTIGGPANDLDRSDYSADYADGLGTVQRVTGVVSRTAGDIAAFEAASNPHPFRLQSQTESVQPVGKRLFATDAAGNTLVEITKGGDVELVALLPDRSDGTDSYEAVPTGLAEGPDGALYVSDLTGFPFPEGGAIVWRLGEGGLETYATGFTTAIDLGFGPDGSLYVVENRGPLGQSGRVLRLDPGENDAADAEVILDGLSFPTGIAIDDDGAVYVSNNGVFAGIGEVLRIG